MKIKIAKRVLRANERAIVLREVRFKPSLDRRIREAIRVLIREGQ